MQHWHIPDFLEAEKTSCFLKYFVYLIEYQSILNIHDQSENQISITQGLDLLCNTSKEPKQCQHSQLTLQTITKLDELMLKENLTADDLKLSKHDIGETNLGIFDFEWIFKVHSIIETYN
jgi:hypothetical protein